MTVSLKILTEDVLVEHPALHGLAADVPQLEGAVLVGRHSRPLEIKVHSCCRAVVLTVNIRRVSGRDFPIQFPYNQDEVF